MEEPKISESQIINQLYSQAKEEINEISSELHVKGLVKKVSKKIINGCQQRRLFIDQDAQTIAATCIFQSIILNSQPQSVEDNFLRDVLSEFNIPSSVIQANQELI